MPIMNLRKHAFSLLIIPVLLCSFSTYALSIKGKVYDVKNNKPMADVEVMNIYTNEAMITDSSGTFTIHVEKGQLVEFRRLGYDIARVRIESEQIAPFYAIGMREGAIELGEVQIWQRGRGTWKEDSVRNAETYKAALQHYKLEGFDMIKHPFDALSKRNRRIWNFQKQYEAFENEKFIDYVFNERLIVQLTKLGSDSMNVYMRLYRPNYFQVTEWSEYEFYEYIKKSVAEFRHYDMMRREPEPGE
jgi:hypothetical protein